MTRLRFRVFGVLTVAALSAIVVAAQPAGADDSHTKHVLLISVDGLHQSDLTWYVSKHPDSTLAKLVHDGKSYSHAMTPFPSDSYPGIVSQATGGKFPGTTGIYYDDSFNHNLYAPGSNCSGSAGTEVTYFEALDKNPNLLSAGDPGVNPAGLPDNILSMTGNAKSLIDNTQLPLDKTKGCAPVYPDQYIKVNTIFDVARAAGLRTAWTDKHAAYEVLNGPSGTGVQDLFAPEINSLATAAGVTTWTAGSDWTKDNGLTQMYDSFKVQSVINEIDGFDHSGKNRVGTPAIFGMNFQTVSTAQKLPSGGYSLKADGTTVPAPLLESALDDVNNKIGDMQAALKRRGLEGNTTIVLSSKHGQSPINPKDLTRIDDGAIIDRLNADWKAADPVHHTTDLVAFAIDDDGWLMWTNDRSSAALDFAKTHLLSYSGTGTDVTGAKKAYTNSGLTSVTVGLDAAEMFGLNATDERAPDVVGVAKVGTVYTGGKGKIAEHGGDNPADRNVPIVVSGAGVEEGPVNSTPVDTAQIAPTILRLLGLDPNQLKAVQKEHTAELPGF